MSTDTVKQMWESNAELWVELRRLGCDVIGDQINTPAFLDLLPSIAGLRGVDIGCGGGHNTTQLAKLGAKMCAIDLSEAMIRAAQESDYDDIEYRCGSAAQLPYDDESFDFAIAMMSLMDIANFDQVVDEVQRVLRPKGFFQFSILHPCFCGAGFRWLRDEQGNKEAIIVKDYFKRSEGDVIDRWLFKDAPQHYKKAGLQLEIPRFARKLSDWLNPFLERGFQIERLCEPCASDELIQRTPRLADTRIIAHFLHVRVRKA